MTAAAVAPIAQPPVVQSIEVAPVQVAVTVHAEPISNAAVSAFAHLSDFAFWESFDFDSAPAQPVAAVVAETPKRPVPTVESIIAQFRTVEWNKQKVEDAPVAAVAQPVVTEPAPQPVVAPVAEVKVEAPIIPESVAVQIEAPATPAVEAAAPKIEEVVAAVEEPVEADVVLNVVEEQIVEEAEQPAPVAAPVPAKAAPSIALYQPQPLPGQRRSLCMATMSFRRVICFRSRHRLKAM